MELLSKRPNSFSKKQVHKVGSALRKGEGFDEDVLENFLDHQAMMCGEVWAIAGDVMNCLLRPFSFGSPENIFPGSRSFYITARVKTRDTLKEKLQRMPTYPLENIDDISGVRLDVDATLREQYQLAEMLQRDLVTYGADKVELKDLRSEPHSGYRAIHLLVRSPAGRAEIQIRTSLQSRWANLYELAADIYGRNIRYLEFGEKVPKEAQDEVQALHETSAFIQELERQVDSETIPFQGTETTELQNEPLFQMQRRIYDILGHKRDQLMALREDGKNQPKEGDR